ncbi:AMP-binding protein [Dyadobacter luticola]|uniref:Acyl-CoA synthetase n=1 Tax=Dyadobacter luticola TaxID=1979387 RepID=A0A5R9L419_9BACT|nr:AMP-binding protein [Dyadobacter luticola]TLV03127.1 acyl-CoA synthetase [Dyadobacter luticola]
MIWTTSISDLNDAKRPGEPYFAGAWDFMKAWLGGQQEFTLHTSGSTGTPKPINLTRVQMSASARMTGKALQLGKGTRALVCLNVSYIAGLMMLVRGMELDWELTIIEPSSNPLADIEPEMQFDFAALVPLQLTEILANVETKNRDNSLGKILLGGAPVDVSLQKVISKLPVPIYQSYGMTETVSHVALRQLNGAEPSENYEFLPEIRFGTDDRGCLFVLGPVTNNEIVQTNDLVEISGNTFKWIGRADNIINSGGVKIVLDKIDAVVAEVFDDLNLSKSFFSWSAPDEKLGQKLVLVIESITDEDIANRILKEIRGLVSAYETPKHIYFVTKFARTPSNKVDKRATFQQLLES